MQSDQIFLSWHLSKIPYFPLLSLSDFSFELIIPKEKKKTQTKTNKKNHNTLATAKCITFYTVDY